MFKRFFLAAVISLATLHLLPASAQSSAPQAGRAAADAPAKAVTGYAPVNGLKMHYQILGRGKPLVVLHGGVGASEMFGANLQELAKSRQVIAVHLQGHGHTQDIDRPFSYDFMADDVAALVAHLKLKKVDVLGYSLGGGVAILTAIRHAAMVDRLVVVGAAMKRSAYFPEVRTAFEQMPANAAGIAKNLKGSPMATMYPKADWEALFRKLGQLLSNDYDWSAGVAAIKSPTLLVFADADVMRLEHITEFYQLLGGGQRDAGFDGKLRPLSRLAIVPGTTHYNLLATTAVAELANGFLGAAVRTTP